MRGKAAVAVLEAAGYAVDTVEAAGVTYDVVLRGVAKPVERHGLLAMVAALESSAGAALDVETVERLHVLGRDVQADRFVAELVEQFVVDTGVRLVAMRDAVNVVDLDAVGRLAHALRGAAGQLGGRRLVAACVTLEDAVEAGAADEVGSALAVVEREYGILQLALAAEVEGRE